MATNNIKIRESYPEDLADIVRVNDLAFGEPDEGKLVQDILSDPSALPVVSLIATSDGEQVVGHILFSRAKLSRPPPRADDEISVSLLAPLSVIPEYQNKGIGRMLIREGLDRLRAAGCQLVFVTGHPKYYPREGFEPAGRHGFTAPYPIEEKNKDGWMVQALVPGLLKECEGKVICSDSLDKPEYWRE